MLNPSVGLMVLMSSPLMRFTIVVFPALSSPLRARGSSDMPAARQAAPPAHTGRR